MNNEVYKCPPRRAPTLRGGHLTLLAIVSERHFVSLVKSSRPPKLTDLTCTNAYPTRSNTPAVKPCTPSARTPSPPLPDTASMSPNGKSNQASIAQLNALLPSALDMTRGVTPEGIYRIPVIAVYTRMSLKVTPSRRSGLGGEQEAQADRDVDWSGREGCVG